MSILHVNQIARKVTELFSSFIDKSDLKSTDKDFETKVQTRCLAAYAVYSHTGCSIEEAAKSVVDGPDDNGIDAIYHSASLKEMVIVQSKWIKDGSGEPESGDIAKYCKGIEDLFNLNFERFNLKINKLQSVIENALSNFDTRYVFIVIYTGDKGLAIHSQRLIDDLVLKLNDAGEGVIENLVSFKKLDQGRIYSLLSKGLFNDPIDIEIGLYQWGKVAEPYGAYYGFISGEEIYNLWTAYGRKLFNKNIRNVLGKTEVNDELILTLRESPEKFWYFNNGITITAEKIEKSMVGGSKRELGNFKLNGASIVNGAQTVSSIGSSGDRFFENLKKVYVLTRIISLENTPTEFGNQVTKANNRQNRIENRDFVSQDIEQIRIKEELAHDGISYNIVRSDSFTSSSKSFDIEEATIALACASDEIGLPVQAKREVGKFYENLNKGIYKQIFNPRTSGRYVYNTILLNREIDKAILSKINSLGKKSGKEYGILVHGNRFLSFLIQSKISIPKDNFINLNPESIRTILDESLTKLKEIVSTDYPDNVLGTLFKNKSKCEAIFEKCK